MSEKIDRKQLKLKKYEEESSVIRGLLYKASDWSTSTLMTDVSGFDNKSSTWNQWEIKYPDLNEGQIITWQPLYNLVRFVAYSNETAFVDSADIYLDLSVFRDYSLFTELISGVDNMGKNTYFYKYNDSKYSQFDIAPWDLDLTWGMTYIDRIEKYDNSKIGMGDLRLVSRLKEYNYGIFSVDSMAYRYAQLRETYFDRDSLYNRFLTYINRLITSGAGKRNQDRWGTNDLDKELQFLSVWIDNRLSFLDDKYGYTGIHKEKNSINEVLVDNASDRVSSVWRDGNQIYIHKPTLGSVNVYSISGRLMKHIEVSGEDVVCLGAFHSGIYVVNGAKIYIP
jgi:spore coat protein CotH